MEKVAILILKFVGAFALIYLFYYFTTLKQLKKKKKPTKTDLNIEGRLFVNIYQVDFNKISFYKLSRDLSIINAINVGVILLITEITDVFFVKILLAFVLIFLVMFCSYKLYGIYLKKKGMIKNV